MVGSDLKSDMLAANMGTGLNLKCNSACCENIGSIDATCTAVQNLEKKRQEGEGKNKK